MTAAPSPEALEKELRRLRLQLERCQRFRARAEELRENNDRLLRSAIQELHDTQGRLEEAKAALEGRVQERTLALVAANTELQLQLQERERLGRELAATRDAAIAANQAKSTFLAMMSHELRTPLNIIIGYAELVQESVVDGDHARVLGDVTQIHGSAVHLLAIINDILDLAKVEAGGIEPNLEVIAIPEFIHDLAATIHPLVLQGGNRLHVTIDPSLAAHTSDRLRLRQTLFNLLSNACKFTEGGEIFLRVADHADALVFEVEDTGIGIPADRIDSLFEPFTQVDTAATRRHGGTGLGLSLCRRFTELLGGSLSARSTLGEGSTFTLRLPTRPAPRG